MKYECSQVISFEVSSEDTLATILAQNLFDTSLDKL